MVGISTKGEGLCNKSNDKIEEITENIGAFYYG